MNLGNHESCNGAPELSVRVAGAGFASCEVTQFPADALDVATLVFDSAQVPVAAGVRGAFASARHLFYKSGSVCIDVRMQPKPGSDSVVLIGQLLDSTSPTHGMGDIPVSLVCEGNTVSRRKTNNFGEFDFGFETLHHTQLMFGIGKRRTIVVSVPDAEVEAA